VFETLAVNEPAEPLPAGAFRPFRITSVKLGDCSYAISERSIAFPFAALRIFARTSRPATRALIVAPMSGAFPILMRDLVVGALRHFDEVAITDWADARYVPAARGRFALSENVEHVEAMVEALGPGVDVIAICQGVTAGMAATALLSAAHSDATPNSLTLVAGPVDALSRRTRVATLLRAASPRWFERNAIEEVSAAFPGHGRRIFPRRHQIETLSTYLCRHFAQGLELFWKFAHDDGEDPANFPFYGLCWSLMDLPAELFLDTVRHVYQSTSLANGTLMVGSRRVDLAAITHTGLLTIEGEVDDISAPGQTVAAHRLCPSLPLEWQRTLLVPRAGHFSLFHGEVCRRTVLPAIVDVANTARLLGRAGGNPPKRDLRVSAQAVPDTHGVGADAFPT
jgi:poly(3-hydroxybutyrate) depolymerase